MGKFNVCRQNVAQNSKCISPLVPEQRLQPGGQRLPLWQRELVAAEPTVQPVRRPAVLRRDAQLPARVVAGRAVPAIAAADAPARDPVSSAHGAPRGGEAERIRSVSWSL